MKILILILTILSTSSALAVENWFPLGKAGAKTRYTSKQKCETVEGQFCYDVSGKDIRTHVLQTSSVDDPTKPIYKSAYNVQVCASTQACEELRPTLDPCNEGDYFQVVENTVVPGFKIQCIGISGYEQITKQLLVEDVTLKNQIDTEDQIKAQADSAYTAKLKDMAFGKRIKTLFSIKADAKNLSLTKRIEASNDFETISRLLDSGSIAAAKQAIEAITPDGVKVTAQDKTDLLTEINNYLTN